MHWKRNCMGKKSNKYIFFKCTFAESREKIARFAEQVCLLFMDCIKIGILFFCSVSPNLVPLVLLLFHLRLLFSHLHAVFSWFRTLTLIPLLSLTYLFLLVFSQVQLCLLHPVPTPFSSLHPTCTYHPSSSSRPSFLFIF